MNKVVGRVNRKGRSMDKVVGGAGSRRRSMDEVVGGACRRGRSMVEGGYDQLVLAIGQVDERYWDILVRGIGNHHRGSHSVLLRRYRDGRGNYCNLFC